MSPNLGRQCIWAELHETGGISATLAVNRLGRCRATDGGRSSDVSESEFKSEDHGFDPLVGQGGGTGFFCPSESTLVHTWFMPDRASCVSIPEFVLI